MTIDYTTLANKDLSKPAYNKRWWTVDSTERPQTLFKTLEHLAQNDDRRQAQYLRNARLYGNVTLLANPAGILARKIDLPGSSHDRASFNVVQAVIDTITAKLSKNKPKSAFLTSGGDWKLQRKAKKLEKFCDGIRYENNGYAMGRIAFRDAAVSGDGFVHVFACHGRVKWERTLAMELFVDSVDSFYGEPRSLYRVKNIDREVLMEMFPEKRNEITNAPAAKIDLTSSTRETSDQIQVIEAWHLPSGPDAKDGLRCLVIENAELYSEAYERPYFPFAKLPWTPRLFGYWSQGIPEQLASIQLEINKISWVIQRSMHLAGTFKIWLKNGSKIVKEQLNNDIGAIINSDDPPQYLLPPIVQPELVQRREALKQEAFEQVGVSQLSASAQKPAGLNSGKALREYNDIESDRFMTIGQAYEQFFLDLDRLSIDVAKEISADVGFEVKVPGKKFLETVDWKDVDLEDDQYVMKAYPVSSLPNEPAGRLQTVQEYVQAGFYTPRTAKRLLDMPDLEQIDDLQDAGENWIHQTLEAIIEDGTYSPPEPEMDLNLAKELVLEYIAQANTTNLEPEKLDHLRLFNTQVDALTMKAMPPPPPQAPPGAPGPGVSVGGAQAVPNAPPQSDMIPNVPGAA